MKKLVLVLIAAFCLTSTYAFAHCGSCGVGDEKGSKSGDYKAKKMKKMTAELGLSEEQAATIEGLMTEKIEKKKALKEELKAVKEEYKGKIRAALNEEQQAKFDAMMEEKKGSKKGSGHDHGDHDHGSKKGS